MMPPEVFFHHNNRINMLSTDERKFVLKTYLQTNSVSKVRSEFRKKYNLPSNSKRIPSRFVIWRLSKKFDAEASVLPGRHKGLTYRSRKADKVKTVKDIVTDNPSISIRHCSAMTGYSKSYIQKVIKKELKMKSYKLQLLHHMKEGDPQKRIIFSDDLLQRGNGFINTIVFSDESTFNLNGKVFTHQARIWGIERPTTFLQYNDRNSPKLNVFCAMSRSKIYGPYFFKGENVKADEYLRMLKYWLLPQLENDIIFMQDGAPPHWACEVRALLNERLPRRWIGRASDADDAIVSWPPRSPDLTPCDFFLWGFIKGKVFCPPLPESIDQMKARIRLAISTITTSLLERVWANFHKRLMKVKARRGRHFEHLRI